MTPTLFRVLRRSTVVLVVAAAAAGALSQQSAASSPADRWSLEQREMLRSLALPSLGPLPADPSNRVADDPRAVRLGKQLFFDTRLSANGKVACATCHAPERHFQDGKALASGIGTTARRTMPIAGTAWSPWQFWDGRADSQWAQALGPLESGVEHGSDRVQVAHVVAAHYRTEYAAVFGAVPNVGDLPLHAGPHSDSVARSAWMHVPAARQLAVNTLFANVGKAIAAFERTITPTPTRFDRYVAALDGATSDADATLSGDEIAGLRLFIGRANCINCHNGARFTDDHFHNTGVRPSPEVTAPDSGRATGVRQALNGEFNCLSRYSDAKATDCAELQYAVTEGESLVRAFKTPSLRDVASRAPYMHAGQLPTLGAVLAHYSLAPRAAVGHSELVPLRLSPREQRQLHAFLLTLSSTPDTTQHVR